MQRVKLFRFQIGGVEGKREWGGVGGDRGGDHGGRRGWLGTQRPQKKRTLIREKKRRKCPE